MSLSLKTIGIDFDNTIICYDRLFHNLAIERGLINASIPVSKQSVRDAVRRSDGGEIAWQKLQAAAYGPMIQQASLFDGVKDFLEFCCRKNLNVAIVSHKGQYAAQDDQHDLRMAAKGFLESNGLFNVKRYGLSEDNVFFEPKRLAKINRIAVLNCDVFVDDLLETYREPEFPGDVFKILFDPYGFAGESEGVFPLRGWKAIQEWLKDAIS